MKRRRAGQGIELNRALSPASSLQSNLAEVRSVRQAGWPEPVGSMSRQQVRKCFDPIQRRQLRIEDDFGLAKNDHFTGESNKPASLRMVIAGRVTARMEEGCFGRLGIFKRIVGAAVLLPEQLYPAVAVGGQLMMDMGEVGDRPPEEQ